MNSHYDIYRVKAIEIQTHLGKFELLSFIFDIDYFKHVATQIDEMERKNWQGPINSFFLFFLEDIKTGFKQTALLEEYLELIINHPTATKGTKKQIKSQVKTNNSTDRLFEISILGNLLKQLPSGNIELFPKTVGNHDVEASVQIDGRWIYIEVTTLNDAEAESGELVEMLNQGGGFGMMKSVDLTKDMDRFIRKMKYKSTQFIPNSPNVLVVSFFGTRLMFIHSQWGAKVGDIVPNIGLLMEFDRKDLTNITTKNCDLTCSLNKKEVSTLRSLLGGKLYRPLVY